ncbi:MAG: precorrin-8X methylmutase, partial [Lachnospiraceae bacterium]
MKTKLEQVLPEEIEKRSFEIITEELGEIKIEEKYAPIIKRVIHTTADFDYVKNLVFSEGVLDIALNALKKGVCIVTDTQMAAAGINKKALAKSGCSICNFIAEEEVALLARTNGTTRSVACMDKAA